VLVGVAVSTGPKAIYVEAGALLEVSAWPPTQHTFAEKKNWLLILAVVLQRVGCAASGSLILEMVV